MPRLRLALVAALLAACYSPNLQNGKQQCGPNGACPNGYSCGPDNHCYKNGQVPKEAPDLAMGPVLDMSMVCTQASCTTPKAICDPESGQCVACLTDGACPDGQLCKNKACVPGCSTSHGCGDGGMCTNGSCTVCKSDADCGGGSPRCDTTSGLCVECLPMNDNCANGDFCKQVNGAYHCLMGCKVDADCVPPPNDGGAPQKMMCCANTCVDVDSDGANCGACGKGCNGQTCCGGSCTDTTMNVADCGGCGLTCNGKQASWTCAASKCAVAMCNANFADCDKDPSDGCEINVSNDPSNCQGCGMKCNLANAVAGCANGCTVASCVAGFGNCDNSPGNGCEVTLATDKNNCGSCGKVCAVANGTAGCANNACTVASCNAGFGDCDMQPNNGCEVTLATDKNNCSKCGMACPTPPNGGPVCAGGVCGLGACNAGFANCNNVPGDGCEINLNTDANNCGGCGKACSKANMATVTCGGGLCNGNCNAGFADCNGSKLLDGCEVNTNTDVNNCGQCGKACGNGFTCTNGACVAVPAGCFRVADVQQNGPMLPQFTSCQSIANNGFTCNNPLVRYGNVPDGIPAMHGNDDFPTWCKQLGCNGFVSVVYGNRDYTAPFGKLFWCSAYDENNPHWCDWQDGLWYNMSLDYHPAQDAQAITQITCN